jgi:hypothetical protein
MSSTVKDITEMPTDAQKMGSGLPEDPGLLGEVTEEEALRLQSSLEGTNQVDRKNEAAELAKQLARPKHGTA